MSDATLRNLLLDCRSTLRRHHRRFEDDPLRAKIDSALTALNKVDDEGELAEPETRTAQQVAYAWQIAVRSLKLTHPDLYDKMSQRVRDMLDAEVLDDPALEIIELERKLESVASAQQDTAREFADLCQALAEVMPLEGNDAAGSDMERAQRRIQMLLKAAASGSGVPKPKVAVDDPLGLSHTRESLLAVAQGRRSLSQGERSWCIAEAMVVTDKKEAELRALKDIELVGLVFAGG